MGANVASGKRVYQPKQAEEAGARLFWENKSHNDNTMNRMVIYPICVFENFAT